ncbi:hypothetical protein [Ferrovum myxofaciens]|uniref:hypothetical protein n=1 Tax=Ferrovum myxofaciens TaxID=416213 RepID=UPI0004E1450B|nr:hypothetical protein [Ferrovum myxofaciens]QKE41371.1 MAG: hypothetical protein HO274_08615 [Ferrovum myxofaciens]
MEQIERDSPLPSLISSADDPEISLSECDSTPERYRLVETPFSKIIGIDKKILEITEEVAVEFMLRMDLQFWDRNALRAYLNSNPFMVRKSTDGFFCIGGFRRFRLAQYLYEESKDQPVTVILRSGKLSSKERMNIVAQEIFIHAAVERADRKDSPAYYKLWTEQLQTKVSLLTGRRDGDFDKAMGFLPRNKKRSHTKCNS